MAKFIFRFFIYIGIIVIKLCKKVIKIMLSSVSGSRVEYDIRAYRNHRKIIPEKSEASLKFKIAAGSVAGTILPMIFLAKRQNTKLYNIKYGLKELIYLSTCGIAGGTAAGVIFDKKEHRKQKINEGVFQFMNATVPTVLCGGLFHLSKKFPLFNNNLFKIGSTIVGLFAGMHIAAALSNKINDPYDKVPDRKLTILDSLANVDDALGVLIMAKVPIAEKLHIEKVLPVIFSWCGYRAGMSN